MCNGAAVSKEHGVAPAHPAFLALVDLHEIGAGVLGVADEHGDAQPIARYVEDSRRAAWAVLDEDEAEHVCAGVEGRVDVVLAGQPAHLHERPRQQLAQLLRRIVGLHQGRADEDRVGAGELRGRAVGARVHTALGDDDRVVLAESSDEVELLCAIDLEGRQVPRVDADHLRAERNRAVELVRVVRLDERLEPELARV